MRKTSTLIATSLVLSGLVFSGVEIAPGAQAKARAATSVPNACKSFTTKSVDKLLGIKTTARPKRHLTKHGAGTQYATSECKVTYKSTSIFVDLSNYASGSGGGYKPKSYPRPKLGTDGKVTVSQPPEAFTSATYQKHGVYVDDDYPGKALPHHGNAMYKFALAQSKRFKKA